MVVALGINGSFEQASIGPALASWHWAKIDVHHDQRMIATCLYTRLVEVLDMAYGPVVTNPDRIIAPSRARRVPSPPGPVGDGKRPGGVTSPKPVQLIGMKFEPETQRVLEIMLLVRAEQNIVSALAAQGSAAGMPVGPGIGDVERVNQRRVGVSAEQQRCILFRQPGSKGDCLLRLDDFPAYARRSMIAHRDKRRFPVLRLDEQDPLGLPPPDLIGQPRTAGKQRLTAGRQPAPGDSDTSPPHGRVVWIRQIDGPNHPVDASGITEDLRRAGIDLLEQHQVRSEFAQQIPLPFRRLAAAEIYVP
jgi:hypothetical protein